ncbi:MAG: FAD:protein FMN transferase [Lachnospiraceae bacterium]|nr:FAD:protein FMN transferase [Lachnospiraceae bacterium]
MRRKIIDFLKMLSLSIVLIFAFVAYKKSDSDSGGDYVYQTVYDLAMGTSVQVTIYGNKDKNFKPDDIVDKIKELDEKLISWRSEDSELYKLNHEYKVGEPYYISYGLMKPLMDSAVLSNDSFGALDLTIRPLANLWNIEEATSENFTVPADKEIKDALKYVDYEAVDVVMYEHDNYVVFDREGMMLDLGSTGKGYALDVAYEILKEHNISGAMVSVGGSILIYGTKDSYKKEDNTWKVGIRDPKGSQEDMIGYLEYPCEEGFNKYISTSGNYEKYIEKDGVIYHHIFESKTGYPASSGLASVTVICDNGLKSDGLSTACFVLGYEKSKDLLGHYNAEAIFIDEDNNVTVTDGLKEIYKDN